MNLQFDGQTVRVTGFSSLSAANASRFREQLQAPLLRHDRVEVDLSRVEFIDSHGLAALIWARNTVRSSAGQFRLLRPAPRVEFLLDLTRTRDSFDIVEEATASAQAD